VPGFSQIDTARSQLATDAVARGFEELMWIDSDTEFDLAAVERLRSHNLPIVSGLYPKKGMRALASSLLPETEKIIFGEGGELVEIRYAATGFLLTKRQVYLDIQRKCNLPVCNLMFNKPLVPLFMTMVVEVAGEERGQGLGTRGQGTGAVWAEAHTTVDTHSSAGDTHSEPYSPLTYSRREAALASLGGFRLQPPRPPSRLQNLRRLDNPARPHRPLYLRLGRRRHDAAALQGFRVPSIRREAVVNGKLTSAAAAWLGLNSSP
jgi:hypothetical protein